MAIELPWHSTSNWQPTQFLRFEAGMETSMQTARIVTDAGHAYIKAMGSHESPQLLAVEFVATRLAEWFKLPVLDFGIIDVDADVDEIPLKNNNFAQSGPAFVTRAIDAHVWGGSRGELDTLVNSHDVGRLVVFESGGGSESLGGPDMSSRQLCGRPRASGGCGEMLAGEVIRLLGSARRNSAMTPQKGYYSLIQFCPDASRQEKVNIGVLLFCPASGFLDARTSRSTRHAEKLVGRGQLARKALKQAQSSIEQRLKVDRESFQDIESLNRFVATRGNSLQLTAPRPIKVFDPHSCLEQLFDELVGGTSSTMRPARSLFPKLEDLFVRLNAQGRAEVDFHSRLPLLEQEFRVPFAYRNGALNLVKPQVFNDRAPQKALDLAIRGSLIHKHGLPDEPDSRLVVVSRFELRCEPDFVVHVDRLLSEYHVKHVPERELDLFISLVESEAHN